MVHQHPYPKALYEYQYLKYVVDLHLYYHKYNSVYLSLEEAKYSTNSTKRLDNAAEIAKTKLEIKKLETELDIIIKNK